MHPDSHTNTSPAAIDIMRPQTSLATISIFLVLELWLTFPWPAVSQSRVRFLPGFDGPLPFHLETGYIGVGESNQQQFFYYFVESERDPKEDPLVLWLNGGPGCSAWSGLTYEIGPLFYEYAVYDGSLPTLKQRKYSWTKVSSIIFVDSPVPTGFSFSNGSENYVAGDETYPKEVYQFLMKWLKAHPQFLPNPLYIGGDSYNGFIIPVVANEIANGIEAGQNPVLNFKGYYLGNPKTDRPIDDGSYVPYAHRMSLISDELYESAKKSCGGAYAHPNNPKCRKDIEAIKANIARITTGQILEPKCAFLSPKISEMGHGRSFDENSRRLHLPGTLPSFGCREYWYLLSYHWTNNADVRKALHVAEGTVYEWKRCNLSIPYIQSLKSSVKYHLNLNSRGYRTLIYSGDHDMVVSIVGTEQWIKSLNFAIVDDWRPWMVDGQVAGYTRLYSNDFTFATVKGAGHTAPEYKPKECLAMFKRWLSHKPL